MEYKEKQELKDQFTTAIYKRYTEGETFILAAEVLKMAHEIIDEYYRRRQNEKNRSTTDSEK